MARSDPSQPPVSMEREREKVIEQLSQHFAHDNLTLDELERRMGLVYQASSIQSLRELTRDLPSQDAPLPVRAPAPVPQAFLPESGRIVSVMAQTKRKGVWQPNLAASLPAIAAMEQPHFAEVRMQRLHHILRQHRRPIARPLAVAHDDLPVREVDVLHPQRQALDLPQPRAIQQRSHQPRAPR